MSTRDITLTWDDPNLIEKGYRVYRSNSPMDTSNMPAPIAELEPNSSEFIDNGQTIGDTNYYRVSGWIEGHEVFSGEYEVEINQINYIPDINVEDYTVVSYEVSDMVYPYGIEFSINGKYLFEASYTQTLNIHTLSTQYDARTITNTTKIDRIGGNYLSTPVDIDFSDDGLIMLYYIYTNRTAMYELNTPYEVATATRVFEFNHGTQGGSTTANNGMFYIVSSRANYIDIYPLTNPYDLRTADTKMTVTGLQSSVYSMAVSSSGKSFYYVNRARKLFQYRMDIAHDFQNMYFVDVLDIPNTAYGITISPDGKHIYLTDNSSKMVVLEKTN